MLLVHRSRQPSNDKRESMAYFHTANATQQCSSRPTKDHRAAWLHVSPAMTGPSQAQGHDIGPSATIYQRYLHVPLRANIKNKITNKGRSGQGPLKTNARLCSINLHKIHKITTSPRHAHPLPIISLVFFFFFLTFFTFRKSLCTSDKNVSNILFMVPGAKIAAGVGGGRGWLPTPSAGSTEKKHFRVLEVLITVAVTKTRRKNKYTPRTYGMVATHPSTLFASFAKRRAANSPQQRVLNSTVQQQ